MRGRELVASLILEPFGVIVDDLSAGMADRNGAAFRIDGSVPVGKVRMQIATCFGWALTEDWSAPEATARAWYVSEEKLEPRLGERFEEPIAEYEQPLAPGPRRGACLCGHGRSRSDEPVAASFWSIPNTGTPCDGHRSASMHRTPRSETTPSAPRFCPSTCCGRNCRSSVPPISIPRSDRWVRICMFAGAPYPEETEGGER